MLSPRTCQPPKFDFRSLPELLVTSAGMIQWDTVYHHLDYIAETWNEQARKLRNLCQAQDRDNQQYKALRNEHRQILRTQGYAAARRHQLKYAEYDSHLFLNIHDDSPWEMDYDSRTDVKIHKGFAHFSEKARKAADICKHRWSPMLIATKLEQMRLFADRFSPTDPSIASSVDWPALNGTLVEYVMRPYREALQETTTHLLRVIESLLLGAAMGAVLGSSTHIEGQNSGPKLAPTHRDLGTSATAPAADDNGVVASVVVEDIVHSEPAAVIDKEVAELQVQAEGDDQFAHAAERRIRASAAHPLRSEKVHLLSFRAGQGELFRKMLLEDKEFKPLRLRLQEAGCPLKVRPSETIVLVNPSQYFDVMSALGKRKTKRYQLLITESVEYLMDQVLARMASKNRPREKRGERLEFNVDVCKFVSRRSFICEAPKLLKADAVSQSTTEALRSGSSSSHGYFAHARGINPRRYTVGSL